MWDAATSASLATLTGHTHYLKSMVWSPDGNKIASTSSDQTVRVWDVATGAALATITNNNNLGTQVAWSPDSSKIASGTANDGTVGVWDATTVQAWLPHRSTLTIPATWPGRPTAQTRYLV